MLYIFSGNPHSGGARNLATALGVRRIRHSGSTARPRQGDRVINWGAGSNFPALWMGSSVVNQPGAILAASNKLSFFDIANTMLYADKKICPEHTQDIEEAKRWMQENNWNIVCRTVLNGHSGVGITIAEQIEQLINAPLYVRYIKKTSEYRVHVFKGDVIDVQQKAKRNGVEVTDWRIRNHANGFIYKREDVNPHPSVLEVAKIALDITGLDFGAVDVVWNDTHERAYVLEVNTAPGLEGTTVEKYASAIRKFIEA